MLTSEQNALATRTGARTPAGILLRHYWQPVALVEQLSADRPIVPVHAFGQHLVLFRDERGRYGLLDRDCPHRNADLAYGRLEDGGLRCAFHGWLFDVGGTCLEMPAEPLDSRFKEKVAQRSYPVCERNGILFGYLGTGEPPAFPHLDCFLAPDAYSFAFKGFWECNWLQALEVGIDPAHASYLHRFFEDEDAEAGYGRQFRAATASTIPVTKVLREYARPEISIEQKNFGFSLCALRRIDAEQTHVRLTNLLFPNIICVPMSETMTLTQWHVPIDDVSSYWYTIFTSYGAPVDAAEMRRQRLELYTLPDYKPRVGKANAYGFRAEEQRTATYTGMGDDINVHDQWAVESQGPIQDRTREHLGQSDKGITAYRKLLFDSIRAAGEGAKLPMVLDEREAAEVRGPGSIDGLGPTSDWQAYWATSDRDASGGRAVACAKRGVRVSFVEEYALLSAEQSAAGSDLARRTATEGIELIRLGFVDQHGIIRGKTIVASELAAALANGYRITTTLLLKDTSHRTVFPAFTAGAGLGMEEMQDAGDMTMVPDPLTYRELPWAPGSASMLCDLYFQSGVAVPFSTRGILKRSLLALADEGYDFIAGLEVEFHLFRLTDPHLSLGDSGQPATPPDVAFVAHGYQYLTELRYDQLDPIFEILRKTLQALELPLRSLEIEFGPGQCEFTFGAQSGIAAADSMVVLRNAIKQVARRHGYHATFMCRPKIANVFSSGWHLHQSLVDRRTLRNVFASDADSTELLSETGRYYLGGLLAHAACATPFSTPTINGYRRYQTHTLAPDRIAWGAENKAAMVRVCGERGNPSTHLENRVGEPAANPYLYMAAQIVSGLDGMRRKLEPGPSADVRTQPAAPLLPVSLEKALAALAESRLFRTAFGDGFIDYYMHIKRAEIARFELEVTEWEQREYFELF